MPSFTVKQQGDYYLNYEGLQANRFIRRKNLISFGREIQTNLEEQLKRIELSLSPRCFSSPNP